MLLFITLNPLSCSSESAVSREWVEFLYEVQPPHAISVGSDDTTLFLDLKSQKAYLLMSVSALGGKK